MRSMKNKCCSRSSGVVAGVIFIFLGTFLSAQSLTPSQLQARFNTGVDFYSHGRWQEAVQELRLVHSQAVTKEQRAEALFWISLSELSAGQYAEALRDMDALVETDPANFRIAELLYHRGRVLYYLGRFDESIVNLKRYADSFVNESGSVKNPADGDKRAAALYWIGECLFSMGQLDMAVDIFRYVAAEFPASTKYEASVYKIDLINQKKIEAELLNLLKLSHEESLRNMEEFRRREATYEQAMIAYQRRIAEMLRDTRLQDLENENSQYRQKLEAAESRITTLENSLRETTTVLDQFRYTTSLERLRNLRSSAQEIENRIGGN